MAASGRKRVTVQYRKLDDFTGGFAGKQLQPALSDALKHVGPEGVIGESAAVRQHEVDKNYGTVVLNYYEDRPEFFFGEFVRFEPGADLPLVQIENSKVKAYQLTQAKAPSGHEPVRGVMYLMAIGNDVVLVEGDLTTGRVEAYLTWLLGEATPTVAKGSHVILLAELAPQAGGAQLGQVEEVVFRPQPLARPEPPPPPGEQVEAVVGTSRREVSETNTFEVLRAAGMDDADLQQLVESETQLEVTLQIKFKGMRRRKRPVGIDTANRLLRNIPEDELTLLGPGGRQREGRIVKLTYPANIETVGSFLKAEDAARALYEGYKYFVSNGYIGE
jgi:hypothetical protein